MITKTIRATALVGLLAATALVASPLSAAGTEPTPLTHIDAPEGTAGHEGLGDDTKIVPAAVERAEALGIPQFETEADGSPSTLSASTGTHRIFVSVVSVTSSTSDDVNTGLEIQAAKDAVVAINAYWQAESAGKVKFTYAGYETRSLNASSCNPDAIWNTQQNVAFGGKFANGKWVGTDDHLLTMTKEKQLCSSRGFGSVGLGGGLIFSANGFEPVIGLPILLHEYGHNLGFQHANGAVCRSASIDGTASAFKFVTYTGEPTTTSVACPVDEYNDRLDIMGYSINNATPHASSLERFAAGWMSATKPAIGKTSTITVQPLNDTSGTRAVRVVDPRTGVVYFVEYRTKEGRDATAQEFANTNPGTYAAYTYSGNYAFGFYSGDSANGKVRILRSVKHPIAGQPANSTVLAVNPVSQDGRERLNSLPVGGSFTTNGGGTKITVSSMNPATGAVIKFTSAKSNSKVSSKPAKSSIKKNKSSKLKITVTAVGNSKPTGTVTVYAKGKKLKAYPLYASKSGKVTVTLPKFKKKGSYSITVKYSGSTNALASSSKAVKLKVK